MAKKMEKQLKAEGPGPTKLGGVPRTENKKIPNWMKDKSLIPVLIKKVA
ncbi:MAG: hypothetical protein WAV11_03850 [Minisyncoccia bacterium]